MIYVKKRSKTLPEVVVKKWTYICAVQIMVIYRKHFHGKSHVAMRVAMYHRGVYAWENMTTKRSFFNTIKTKISVQGMNIRYRFEISFARLLHLIAKSLILH